jgi:hypothetical protein
MPILMPGRAHFYAWEWCGSVPGQQLACYVLSQHIIEAYSEMDVEFVQYWINATGQPQTLASSRLCKSSARRTAAAWRRAWARCTCERADAPHQPPPGLQIIFQLGPYRFPTDIDEALFLARGTLEFNDRPTRCRSSGPRWRRACQCCDSCL